MEDLQKRHQKQRDQIQKQQQSNVDKMMSDSAKQSKKKGAGSVTTTSRHSSLSTKASDPTTMNDMFNDHKVFVLTVVCV